MAKTTSSASSSPALNPAAPEILHYYIDPFGCAKNQVDAENMMAYLDHAGYSAAQEPDDADIIIVNSCGFIESAKQESINAVLSWRKLYPGKKILLAGCLAQRYAKELAESLPEADGFFGVDDISGITEKVNLLVNTSHKGTELQSHKERKSVYELPSSPQPLPTPYSSRPLLSLPGSAYVKISEGCDNRCAFCAIPLIRGPLRCRAVADIVEECRGLLARGIRELCIIGQDIGSYRSGAMGLPELLNAIAELEGNFWVRLLYMHPDHFPLPILDIMERDLRFLPYFDIPFQHASPGILPAMNRRGTAETYISLVETIRARFPASAHGGAVIRTTLLTGFPGETDADFAALLDFQKKINPDWLGCFTFSREEGTPAYTLPKQVPPKIAAKRQRQVEELQIQLSEKNMERFVGQKLHVLLEEQFTGDEELWLGRLYCHAPEVDGAAVVTGIADNIKPQAGDILPCKVTARRGFDLVCMV